MAKYEEDVQVKTLSYKKKEWLAIFVGLYPETPVKKMK